MPVNNVINKLTALLLAPLITACTTVHPVSTSITVPESRPAIDLKVTFLGTSSLLFESAAATLLVDGFITRPGLIQNFIGTIDSDPAVIDRVFKELGTDRIDGIFVAHTHHDHALDSAYIARLFGTSIYGSQSLLHIADNYTLQESQRNLLSGGYAFESRNGLLKLTALIGEHSPPVPFINDDRGRTIGAKFTLPARRAHFYADTSFEFLVQTGDLSIYILPSAAKNNSGTPRPKADVLFIAAPKTGLLSNQYAQDYVQQALAEIDPQLVIPVHWDNFTRPLSRSLKGNPLFTANLKLIRDLVEEQNRNYCVLQALQVLKAEESGVLVCGLDRPGTSVGLDSANLSDHGFR